MNNPYTLSFGIEPNEYISRTVQMNQITDMFTSDVPSNYLYLLSGVRGAGKTVMLSNLSDTFANMKNWVVINVSPDVDILNSIAANLYSRRGLQNLFIDAKIDLSGLGIGVSLTNSTPIFDITVALESLLKELKKKKYRVLIVIDEIINNKYVRAFASVYQILLRSKLPVFLLMTGLYENINNLQNEKSLTFLYRAPKIYLEPLSIASIAIRYKAVFKLNNEEAKKLAHLTNGYAFAYQALGYLYWDKIVESNDKCDFDELISYYDSTLSEYVYEKIWFELPETEKSIITLLVLNGRMKVKDICNSLDMPNNKLSVYRDRLKRKGLINTSEYGYLSLNLPRFGEIAKFWV
jgi:hypothetical protein